MESVRGSGRTTRQIREAPERHYYLVSDPRQFEMVRSLARRHAPTKTALPLCIEDLDTTRGSSTPIVVDHHVLEMGLHRDLLAYINQHNEFVASLR